MPYLAHLVERMEDEFPDVFGTGGGNYISSVPATDGKAVVNLYVDASGKLTVEYETDPASSAVIESTPAQDGKKVTNMYVNASGRLTVEYETGA